MDGKFIAPDFEGFRVISGPNFNSYYSMINGEVTQRSSYSYQLLPLEEGHLVISPATLRQTEDEVTLEPIEVIVLPNPDGSINNPGRIMQFSRPLKSPLDTLSEAQKQLRKKLSKGKKYKI